MAPEPQVRRENEAGAKQRTCPGFPERKRQCRGGARQPQGKALVLEPRESGFTSGRADCGQSQLNGGGPNPTDPARSQPQPQDAQQDGDSTAAPGPDGAAQSCAVALRNPEPERQDLGRP